MGGKFSLQVSILAFRAAKDLTLKIIEKTIYALKFSREWIKAFVNKSIKRTKRSCARLAKKIGKTSKLPAAFHL